MHWVVPAKGQGHLRKLSEEDKRVLLFLMYFSLTILFFPLGFVAWYGLNRKTVNPFFPFGAITVMLAFGLASHLYVYRPLLVRHIDLGTWSAVIYGGMLSAHLFLFGFLCPNRMAGRVFLTLYYVSCGILALSVVSWSIIPRYHLAGGIDTGTVVLAILGLAWVSFLIAANRFAPPIRSIVRNTDFRRENPVLIAVWLLIAGDLTVARMIYNMCRLTLVHR
jgi:uncharacterized membrane protein YqjE